MFNTLIGGVGSMFFYGTSDFFAKTVIDKIGNLKSLIYVQLIGVVVYLSYFVFDSKLPAFSAKNIGMLILCGILYTSLYICLYSAFEKGKMGIVSPVGSTYAPMVAVLSYFFLGEAFPDRKIIIVILITIGVLLTSVNFADFKSGSGTKSLAAGVPQALTSAVLYAFFVPFFSKLMEQDGWAVWAILIRFFPVILVSIYLAFLRKEKLTISLSAKLKLALILSSVTEGLAFFTLSYALNKADTSVSIATAVQSGFPLVTGILAYLFLKERLGLNQYVGSILIIIGVIAFALS